jgi:hypothetical protein
MCHIVLARGGKLLLASASLLALAGCGDATSPVDDEVPATEMAIATSDPSLSDPLTSPATDEPTAETSPEPVAKSVLTPSAEEAAPTPAATPVPTAAPDADPHAGHDMSTMSDEEMKAMGHE